MKPSRPLWGILALMLLALLPACQALPVHLAPAPTPGPPMPPTPLPQAVVTFVVDVPTDTPTDGTIALGLLDEVTGLSLNPRWVPMEPGDAHQYTAQVPLTQGSVVKYRYGRLREGGAVLEFTTDGLPVRYRMVRVDGPMVVHDLVARWNDTPYNGPVGRIQGEVTDPQGNPIPDVLLAAGGRQTLTTADGSFLLDGLPPGVHNLVAYHLDQRYTVYQQLAEVAPEAATPAQVRLNPRPLVSVTFSVRLPESKPRNPPVRLIGNLYSLGNTYGDLIGGLNTLAVRAPLMQPVGDLQYALSIPLPAGAYIRYKYSLGDGYWNAERDAEGHFVTREFIVPDHDAQVQDVVQTWQSPEAGPVWLEVRVPEDTPPQDTVTLQLNPVVWTNPLPMWRLDAHRWGYLLYGPWVPGERVGFRLCRNAACDAAPEGDQYGPQAQGAPIEVSTVPQNVEHEVDAWAWYAAPETGTAILAPEKVAPRPGFLAGVALSPAYSPLWTPTLPQAFREIGEHLGAQWVFLTPTWSATRVNLPVFEPVPGRDPLWLDLVTMSGLARQAHLRVGLYPQVRFPATADAWWAEAAHDFGWWNAWFDRYRTMALHFADAASATGAEMLVLGGAWVAPALPGGRLPDGSPSQVPADAEARWRALLQEVRAHFDGPLYWALPFDGQTPSTPPFLDAVDGVWLTWNPPLVQDANAGEPELEQATAKLLDEVVLPWAQKVRRPLLLAPAYAAAPGAVTGCPRYHDACLGPDDLRPGRLPADLSPDLRAQKAAYEALFLALEGREGVHGVVVREFYPPAALQDASPSVYGKPAAEVIAYWYPHWLTSDQP